MLGWVVIKIIYYFLLNKLENNMLIKILKNN